MLETLQQLGLSKKEATVYLALLGLGQTQVSKIIDKTHYHREIVYTSLRRLVEKNLASFVRRKGKRFYQAANPEKILEIAQDNFQVAKGILPQLVNLQKKADRQQFIQVYEGSDGLKQVRELMLRTLKSGDKIRILGTSGKEYFETMGDYYLSWNRRRDQKKIWYLIQCYEPQKRLLKEKLEKPFKYVQVKSLPEKFLTPTSSAIFANCVVIQIWGDEPIMILIENKKVAANYCDVFDVLWKIAK